MDAEKSCLGEWLNLDRWFTKSAHSKPILLKPGSISFIRNIHGLIYNPTTPPSISPP